MKLSINDANDANRKQGAARLILRHGEMLTFRPARGSITVSCMAGCLHLTQTGDPQDHLLLPGDSHTCARTGKSCRDLSEEPGRGGDCSDGTTHGKTRHAMGRPCQACGVIARTAISFHR